MTSYTDACRFLNQQNTVFGLDLKLERMRAYLKSVGNPEKKLRVIHVAGTVGKGSTCTFAAYLLQAAGLKTGLFLSPHLVNYTERIQVLTKKSNRATAHHISQFAIRNSQFLNLFSQIRKNPLGRKLSPFELLTAMAVHYFVDQNVDAAVFEVGLGGRLDSTNALKTDVSVITKIGMDHMQYLGDTIEKIAKEKFGILRKNIPAVMATPELKLLKSNRALAHHNSQFAIRNSQFLPSDCRLKGSHQRTNAALALKAVELLLKRKLTAKEKNTGFTQGFIPARLQLLSTKPLIMLDGAHNADSAQTLAAYLKKTYLTKKWIFIVGILLKKDAYAILEALIPLAHAFYFVPIASSPCYHPSDLKAMIPDRITTMTFRSWKSALKETRYQVLGTRHPSICITGSLYLAGSVLKNGPKR